MSTLRVSNIEAKADASSPSINEKVKVTNSSGDVLIHIDGSTSGITTVGINTTGSSFDIDINQNVTFAGIVTSSSSHVGGATTFGEDLVVTGNARVTGILTVGQSSITLDGATNNITLGDGNISIGSTTLITPTQFTTTGVGAALNTTGTGVTWSPSGPYWWHLIGLIILMLQHMLDLILV